MDKMNQMIHVNVEPNLRDALLLISERKQRPLSWVIRSILRQSEEVITAQAAMAAMVGKNVGPKA